MFQTVFLDQGPGLDYLISFLRQLRQFFKYWFRLFPISFPFHLQKSKAINALTVSKIDLKGLFHKHRRVFPRWTDQAWASKLLQNHFGT